MGTIDRLWNKYKNAANEDLGRASLQQLRKELTGVFSSDILSSQDGRRYIELLRIYRDTIDSITSMNGAKYKEMLSSILSVGEDGLYSDSLRFIFELIQNVDDCDFPAGSDRELDMRFDFNQEEIILNYQEVGFSPANVFAITGIAERAKNISDQSLEIGEKGIGFKSVFGVADEVWIQSGWFSFKLRKDCFTLPEPMYDKFEYVNGTRMTLYVSHDPAAHQSATEAIYDQIRERYCQKQALFSRNPLLFLNKLTKLKMYFDVFRSMEFCVTRDEGEQKSDQIKREDHVQISVNLIHTKNGQDEKTVETINCTRYTYEVTYSRAACQSRYGEDTELGKSGGRRMSLQAVLPDLDSIHKVGNGALYSYLPTQLQFTVPIVCHVPFKLDASREFVHSQDNNLWFEESKKFLSELLDHVYQDWCKVVQRHILCYVPKAKKSIFEVNNGKERCLRALPVFMGEHFLSLPIFYTQQKRYCSHTEIMCFSPKEDIFDPERAYRLLNHNKDLFIPDDRVDLFGYEIEIKTEIYEELFKQAISSPETTSEILKYLDAAGAKFTGVMTRALENQNFATQQLEIIASHPRWFDAVQTAARLAIEKNKLPLFTVQSKKILSVQDVFHSEFELSETPIMIERYLERCGEKYVLLDINEKQYLPCGNALILPRENTLNAFAVFCGDIDPNDTFSIRIKLKKASESLNRLEQTQESNEEEFLRQLKNIRLTVKQSLGNRGYESYTRLLLKSGISKERFIQELIQNADDCTYPEGEVPTFTLKTRDGVITTEYNETGFTKSNVRAITAIGESTKNRLLSGNIQEIGEKGVGFKTVFAVASEVRIESGKFYFALTSKEPTVPRKIDLPRTIETGTRMEFHLREGERTIPYDAKEVLKMVLCLRKLRNIVIDGHKAVIEDTDQKRTVSIDKKKYVYRKVVHKFTVRDPRALAQRNAGRADENNCPEQQIICYIPSHAATGDIYLYSGLPTTHKIKIPLVIDAPFELTTSREEIEQGSAYWNNIVRAEMYAAILKTMEILKRAERSHIFRFVHFRRERHGLLNVYLNDVFDSSYLNAYDFKENLLQHEFLPTYDKDVFLTPESKGAERYPDVVTYLFERGCFGCVKPCAALDIVSNAYDTDIEALGYEEAKFDQTIRAMDRYVGQYIKDPDFRTRFYDYLRSKEPVEERHRIGQMAIIPVYGTEAGTTRFVPWRENSIFVRKGADISENNFYVLNENILSKADCEKFVGGNINEMNFEWERNRYNESLSERIRGNDTEEIYQYVLTEYAKGNLDRFNSWGVLLEGKEMLPMKNELGELTDTELFVSDMQMGYFPVRMLQNITVHKECEQLARRLRYAPLSGIHYENLDYYEPLTEDDVECLRDDYFINSKELLRQSYYEGYLSDELLRLYDLEYLSYGNMPQEGDDEYEFPAAAVLDTNRLRRHIQKMMQTPTEIVRVKEERIVPKGKDINGDLFSLSSDKARERTLETYAPIGKHRMCFCQMCMKVKQNTLIEVNNIELEPRYFFPELRVALCLECSKRFEALRQKTEIREEFLDRLKHAEVGQKSRVEVQFGDATITFTGRHLAEIQEVLNQRPRQNKKH